MNLNEKEELVHKYEMRVLKLNILLLWSDCFNFPVSWLQSQFHKVIAVYEMNEILFLCNKQTAWWKMLCTLDQLRIYRYIDIKRHLGFILRRVQNKFHLELFSIVYSWVFVRHLARAIWKVSKIYFIIEIQIYAWKYIHKTTNIWKIVGLTVNLFLLKNTLCKD